MVSGRTGEPPVLIVDLDGTVLGINSHPRWARRLARGSFPHLSRSRRMALAARATVVLAARKLRLIRHDQAKGRLQLLWQAATHDDCGDSEASLCRELLTFVRPEFQPILAAVRSGSVDAVLATAAAADYAQGFGRALGFTHIIASQLLPRPRTAGSSGERKLRSVMELLAARGWQHRPRILFTDHPDDLPLMSICPTIFWFGTDAHRRACQWLVPGGAIYSPRDEKFASMVRSLGVPVSDRGLVAARSRSIPR